jgi:hypothetical protein
MTIELTNEELELVHAGLRAIQAVHQGAMLDRVPGSYKPRELEPLIERIKQAIPPVVPPPPPVQDGWG